MAVKKEVTKKKSDFEGLSVSDAKKELQKLVLAVKMNEEKNTSKVKKLRRYIAQEKTKESNTNN